MSSNPLLSSEAEPIPEVGVEPLYFIVVFWGKRYRNWFCRYTLASLLSPNNIPSLQGVRNCRFLICTTKSDWNALQREPLFHRLRKFIEPSLILLPPVTAATIRHKYVRMSLGHKLLTNNCFKDRAIAIYTCPDTIIPDGCVKEANRLIQAGKRVVLCTAIRFEMDGVERDIRKGGIRKPDQPLAVSRRQAVEIGLRNLHSESRAGEWDAPNFGELNPRHFQNHFPTCCYWRMPREVGIVIFTHNWAPFAINFATLAEHDTRSFEQWAIDGDYVYRNFKPGVLGQDIHVVNDSDSIILLGLTPRDEMATRNVSYFWQRWPIVGQWSKGFILNKAVFSPYLDELRRGIYNIPVLWHSCELSAESVETKRRAQSILSKFTNIDLSPNAMLASLTNLREVLLFFLSRRFVRFVWIAGLFYLFLPLTEMAVRKLRKGLDKLSNLRNLTFSYRSKD